MLYPYMTLNYGTEICHSQILEGHKVVVNFERPTEDGFDSARCELPSYTWLYNDGYSEEEIRKFTALMHRHAQLFFLYVCGGCGIASGFEMICEE